MTVTDINTTNILKIKKKTQKRNNTVKENKTNKNPFNQD